MKLAIAGKGGVGKTTLASVIARRIAASGKPVVAVDADPDGNLAAALGAPPDEMPEPIAQMRELILERTGARDSGSGLMFKLNPKVDDLPDRFSVTVAGVRLLVLGTVDTGGQGCLCPETTVLKSLMQHLLLRIDDDIVLDMEAGLEHLGRASATGVDAVITVVEPGMRSIQTAEKVAGLSNDIGIDSVYVVVNKVARPDQLAAIQDALGTEAVLGVLPYSEEVADADLRGSPVEPNDTSFAEAVDGVLLKLDEITESPGK